MTLTEKQSHTYALRTFSALSICAPGRATTARRRRWQQSRNRLGVAALIATTAIANGFRDEMRDKILARTAHITLMRATAP